MAEVFNDREDRIMKKYIPLLILAGLLLVIVLPSIHAEIYKQNSIIELKVPCSYNGTFCDTTALCNVTISYPNSSLLVDDGNMTNTGNGMPFYLLPDTSITGVYLYNSECCQADACDSYSSSFEITPSGIIQTSILENPIILILISLGLILLILGIYLFAPAFAFLGALMFLLSGVYTMIYGFNNVADLYTRGIAVTLMGVGIIFMFIIAYEWALMVEET